MRARPRQRRTSRPVPLPRAARRGRRPGQRPAPPPRLGRADFPAVGDWVALRTSADVTGPAVIEAVLPRTNKLSRKAAGESGDEQILAANLDVLFLVTSLNLDLNPRRLERFLAAAALPDCQPVLLLTKSDLCDSSPDAVAEDFRGRLGVVRSTPSAPDRRRPRRPGGLPDRRADRGHARLVRAWASPRC